MRVPHSYGKRHVKYALLPKHDRFKHEHCAPSHKLPVAYSTKEASRKFS